MSITRDYNPARREPNSAANGEWKITGQSAEQSVIGMNCHQMMLLRKFIDELETSTLQKLRREIVTYCSYRVKTYPVHSGNSHTGFAEPFHNLRG